VLMRWLEHALPFNILLLVLFLYKHYQGIMVFSFLTTQLFHINEIMKRQVAAREQRSIPTLLLISVLLSGNIASVLFMFRTQEMWKHFAFLPPPYSLTFFDVLFLTIINDTLLRCMSVVAKALIAMAFGGRLTHRRTAQMYTLVEAISLVYRSLLPIAIWYTYFSEQPESQTFSALTSGLYLMTKVMSLRHKLRYFLAVLKAFVLQEVQYGRYATEEQLAAAESSDCPICQEKMRLPLVLHCQHMFCEDCVSEWFERERTCPLCRAVVKSAGQVCALSSHFYPLLHTAEYSIWSASSLTACIMLQPANGRHIVCMCL